MKGTGLEKYYHSPHSLSNKIIITYHLEQYLNVVTHTKGLDDQVLRDLLPIQQQLVNALLRARVVALSQEQHFFEIARRIRIRNITFYGIWGKWYAWGRHHPVLAELRDGAPLLHLIFKDDKSISRQLAQEWQAAERALVQRGNRGLFCYYYWWMFL